MTRQVKSIAAKARVGGDFGGIFPQAKVSFFHVFKNSQEYLGAKEGDDTYTEQQNYIESITYSANCWPNQETFEAGYKSRPVLNPEPIEGKDENVFIVDVTKPQYMNELNATGASWDSVFKVIELHYRQEVAAK